MPSARDLGAEVRPATPATAKPGAASREVAAAATDNGPRAGLESKLCERGSSPDYAYLIGLIAANVGTIVLDRAFFSRIDAPKDRDGKADDNAPFDRSHSAVRSVGPGLIGLAWGALVPGFYMSLPTCSKTWVASHPPEGEVRSNTSFFIALSLAAVATAPLIVAIQSGPEQFGVATNRYPTGEKSVRVLLPMATSLLGSLLPHVSFLAPKTWRAAMELEQLRLGVTPIANEGKVTGATLGLSARF
jgi:hypothetical protein